MANGKPNSTKFSQPLELETPGRAKLVFRTLEELRDWYQREEAAWNWLRQAGPPGQQAWRTIENQRRQLATAMTQAEQVVRGGGDFTPNHEQQLRSALPQCSRLIASDSKAGKFVLNLKEEGDPDRAGAAAALLLGQELANLSSPAILRGALDVALMEEGITTSSIKAARDAYEEQVAQVTTELADLRSQHLELLAETTALRESASKLLESQKEAHDELLTGHRGATDSALDETKEDPSALKATYDAGLALRAPVTYWSRKKAEHKRLARNFAWASAAGLLVAVVVFAGLVYWIIPREGDPTLGHVAALAILSAPLLWGERVLIRNLLSNIHLATDAAEREVLIQTYLALARKGWAKEEELELVLQAIFRPTSTGLVRDDAAPPGWWEFVTRER